MFWNKELTYWITPKSGPMRGMATLIDANHALSRDLPSGYLKRVYWVDVANLLVQAAESGRDDDVRTLMRTIAGDTDFILTSDVQSAEQTALALQSLASALTRSNPRLLKSPMTEAIDALFAEIQNRERYEPAKFVQKLGALRAAL